MARARNIKPSFFTNEDIVELPFETRLLFIGLWTLADREGRLEDRPRRIKIELFPADTVDVDVCLNQLQDHGFILRYSAGKGRYIQVLAFNKHQYPHKSERDSTIPAPVKHSASTVQEPEEHDVNPPESLLTESLDTEFGIPTPDEGANAPMACDPPQPQSSPSKPTRYPDHFETFWKAYPSGHGVKKQAAEQWKKIPAGERQAVMDGLEAWKASDRWRRGYVKDAQRWLRDRQWEDEPPAPPNTLTVHRGGMDDPDAPIVPGPRGFTQDQLRRLAEQERRRATS